MRARLGRCWRVAWIRKQGPNHWVYWRDGGRGTPTRCVNAGPRRADALRLKSEIEHRRRLAPLGLAIPEPTPFPAFVERWLASRTVERQTSRRERSAINAHLLLRLGHLTLGEIGAEQVESLNAAVAAKTSSGNARRVFSVLRKMLADARRWKLISENPADDVRSPKPRFRHEDFPTVDELCALVAAIPVGYRPIVFTALLTGLRWGELVALRWTDLNLDAGKLVVRRNIPVGNHLPKRPKGGGQRVVDLLPPVRQLLMDLPQRGQLVFPAARGGRINYRRFRESVWAPAMETAELSLTFKTLRHGFASLLLAFGEMVLYVSRQMGHSSAKLTLDTYGHLVEEGRRLDREETLRKLEAALHGATGVRLNDRPKTRKRGAGERIRTADLRITSALSTQSHPSSSSQQSQESAENGPARDG